MKRKLWLPTALLMYLKCFKCILVVTKGLDTEYWKLSCHFIPCDSGTERLLLIASTFSGSSRDLQDYFILNLIVPLSVWSLPICWDLNLVGLKKGFYFDMHSCRTDLEWGCVITYKVSDLHTYSQQKNVQLFPGKLQETGFRAHCQYGWSSDLYRYILLEKLL